MTCGIYKVTNTHNGKIYIGQSYDIERRWVDHRNGRGSKHLFNAIKKYGLEYFTFEVIEVCPEYDFDIDIREIFWIKETKSNVRNIGYNKLSGGSKGRHSDETKALMSAIKKEQYIGEGNPFFGRKHSEESKQKIRDNNAFHRPENRQKAIDALKGKPWPEARRKAFELSKLLKEKTL